MKKRAFTLAEVLVTLCIVGVISAIIAPTLSGIMPDREKAKVIKAYNTLTNVTQEILNNPSYYEFNENGFYRNISSKSFPELVYEHMNTDGAYTGSTFNLNYTTVDGTYWMVTGNTFTIDINGTSKGSNCFYSPTTCKKPDRFAFIIDPSSGEILGSDRLTMAYLLNPYKLNDKKADYKRALGK